MTEAKRAYTCGDPEVDEAILNAPREELENIARYTIVAFRQLDQNVKQLMADRALYTEIGRDAQLGAQVALLQIAAALGVEI